MVLPLLPCVLNGLLTFFFPNEHDAKIASGLQNRIKTKIIDIPSDVAKPSEGIKPTCIKGHG